MMSALTGTALDALLADWGGRGFVDFKAALTEALVAEIAPLRSEILKFNADPAMLDQLLAEGAVKAEAIARPVLERVYDIFGFLRPAQHRPLS
jgi:tryptophanyl-tRNA synthetase